MNVNFNTKNFERNLKRKMNMILEEKQMEFNALKRFEEVKDMKLLNKVEEELLQIVVKNKKSESYVVCGDYSIFPEYIMNQIKVLFTTLKIAGYIADFYLWLNGEWQVTITPMAISYTVDKEEYLKKEEKKMSNQYNINNLTNNGGNLILGNVTNSTFSIKDSFNSIEKEIEEKGGEDIEELKSILDDFRDYIKKIEETKEIKTDKNLVQKLGKHFEKHQWFYSSIVNLLGQLSLLIAGQ